MTLGSTALKDLFAHDAGRVENFSWEAAGIWFDWSKTHIDTAQLVAGVARLERADFVEWRRRLAEGEVVNETEGRAAEHMAERGTGADESVAIARALHARMRGLVEAIHQDLLGEISHIIHVGIGGSKLGPDLLVDALGRENARYELHVVSNVDGMALKEAFGRCDPQRTLLVIASKTFTTSETMLNAASVIEWMEEAGVEDCYGRIVALTADPDKALEWGVDETRILPFSDTVGGRYSLWSSIGFPAALVLGWDAFADLLAGAAAMDQHFMEADPARNAPVVAAVIDRIYVEQFGCQTRAVFAYDERLRELPGYLQQLEMESNGKSVDHQGKRLGVPSAPITWGGVGTDGQHAVFQLLHQGTLIAPMEFLAVIEPGHDLDEAHHLQLLTNCLAQASALMTGRYSDDPARSYPGDRPSVTILLDRIDPFTLGALIAFYEHRTFVNAVMIGNNPFDQFGVELGKEMAREIAESGAGHMDPSTANLAKRIGI